MHTPNKLLAPVQAAILRQAREQLGEDSNNPLLYEMDSICQRINDLQIEILNLRHKLSSMIKVMVKLEKQS